MTNKFQFYYSKYIPQNINDFKKKKKLFVPFAKIETIQKIFFELLEDNDVKNTKKKNSEFPESFTFFSGKNF